MVARQYYSTYEGSEQSTTKTSAPFDELATLTFTPDANADYMMISSAYGRRSSLGRAGWWQSEDGSDTGPWYAIGNLNFVDTAERYSADGFHIHEAGGSPSSLDFDLSGWVNTSGTSYAGDINLIALRLESQDKFNSATFASTTSTSYQTVVSLTFTPATSGWYIVCGSWGLRSLTAGVGVRAYMDIDSDGNFYGYSYTNSTAYGVGDAKLSNYAIYLDNTSHTISIKYRGDGSGTVQCYEPVICALRVDDFPGNPASDYDLVQYNTTSGTYQNSTVSETFTPEAVDHLFLSSATTRLNQYTTAQTQVRTLHDGTEDSYTLRESRTHAQWMHHGHAKIIEYDGSSVTEKIQWRRLVSGTASLAQHSIDVLQLEEAASGLSIPVAYHHRQRN